MYILMVRLKVKQAHIDDFIKASIADGTGSVLTEPDCHRFDIIQDETDPTLFAFNEVYSDVAAFEHHKTTPHFAQWDAAVKPMLDAPVEVSFCRPVFPRGNATWAAQRPGAVEDPAFASSLFVIHAPLPVQADKVDAFIAAVTLDGIGSTNEEPGCLRFDVYQNINKPSELYLYEVYVNKAAFEYHTKTPHIAQWRETVKDWYAGERTGGRRGRNVWPPDNWGWSSGKPTR
ncbi:MAG: putative quinol monooxygenase [Candidatus Tectimicrobiota bacterium]